MTRGGALRAFPERKSKGAEMRRGLVRLIWWLHDTVIVGNVADVICRKLHVAIDGHQRDLQGV